MELQLSRLRTARLAETERLVSFLNKTGAYNPLDLPGGGDGGDGGGVAVPAAVCCSI